LFQVRHADVGLGLMVVEGHARIGEEAQGIVGRVVQAVPRAVATDLDRLRLTPPIRTPAS